MGLGTLWTACIVKEHQLMVYASMVLYFVYVVIQLDRSQHIHVCEAYFHDSIQYMNYCTVLT